MKISEYIMPSICNKCDKQIRGNQKKICCAICKLEYHIKCQGVSEYKHEFLLENTDILWFCKSCKVVTVNMVTKLSDFELRIAAIESSISSQLEINKSVEERMSQLKNMPDTEKSIQDLKENIQELKEKEITSLKEEVSFLRSKLYNHAEVKKLESIETEQRIDNLEQDSKMNNLRIVGIPEEQDENLRHRILTIVQQKLNLETIGEIDIGKCYRLGKAKDSKVRDVIAKFTSRDSRNLVYSCRRNMPREDQPVYINEDLTQPRSKLFFTARRLKKSEKIIATWTQDGKIFVKVTDSSEPVLIKTHADLRNEVFPGSDNQSYCSESSNFEDSDVESY